ncbi:MAG: DNA adenine methylase [Spirochaetaceae bacterium]
MTFKHPYLSRGLIAYIGNKRALLPFLGPVFSALAERAPVHRFVDPFAGSGAVARLGKYLGFAVTAADLEYYAWVLNGAALETHASEARELFGEYGGMKAAFDHFHHVGGAAARRRPSGARSSFGEDGYIARRYAPRDTDRADYRRERLFYTAENARYIDAVRDALEERYPGWRLDERSAREKQLILAALLVEASVHANTSGVFKAYHKGFGGHGRDALGRIMAPAEIEVPPLIDGPDAVVRRSDAAELLANTPADLVYLDPPYNGHQYGSNYFMLNTIARWDKPAVPAERGSDGRLLHKAGIRPDWSETRSDFCSKSRAAAAFRRLMAAVDARFIVLSYSSDGIVPIEEILDLLSERGSVEVFTTDYTQYRGGRQSIERATANVEYAVVATTRSSLRHGKTVGREDVEGRTGAGRGSDGGRPGEKLRAEESVSPERFLRLRAVLSLLGDTYVPERVRRAFATDGDAIVLSCGVRLPMPGLYRFTVSPAEIASLPYDALEELRDGLYGARCRDRREEAHVLLELLRPGRCPPREARDYRARLLRVLRKFAYNKYRREFSAVASEIEEACRHYPVALDGVAAGVAELKELLRRRSEG